MEVGGLQNHKSIEPPLNELEWAIFDKQNWRCGMNQMFSW